MIKSLEERLTEADQGDEGLLKERIIEIADAWLDDYKKDIKSLPGSANAKEKFYIAVGELKFFLKKPASNKTKESTVKP
jgi:hypothetical protein